MNDKQSGLVVGISLLIVTLAVNLFIPFPAAHLQFTLRVILSLAAGLIGGALTGYLGVRVKWVQAGGGMAVFVIVFLVNPPALIEQQQIDRLIAPAEAALQSGNLGRAEDLFKTANERAPDLWEPNWGLSKVAFRTGDFGEALAQSKEVIEKKRRVNEPVQPQDRYQVAMALDALGETEGALGVLSEIVKTAPSDSNVYKDSIFDIGLLNLALRETNEARQQQLLETAKSGFAAYAQAESNPTEWYHYHLACIAASFPTNGDGKEVALAEFERAISMIKSLPRELSRKQAEIMLDTLSGAFPRQPGYPVICPALASLIKQSYPNIESLFAT